MSFNFSPTGVVKRRCEAVSRLDYLGRSALFEPDVLCLTFITERGSFIVGLHCVLAPTLILRQINVPFAP
jgi:hypothetical protein